MERLIDKIFDKVYNIDNNINRIMDIINIKKIRNVEINDESENKLFIYKDYGIQIKNGIKFKIVFFKMINKSNLEKIFELENVKIKVSNTMVYMYKYNEIWNYHLYDNDYQNLLNYFCVKFNIKAMMIE